MDNGNMMQLKIRSVENYLKQIYGSSKVTGISNFGGMPVEVKMHKRFCYGKPYLIEFEAKGISHSVVLSSCVSERFWA